MRVRMWTLSVMLVWAVAASGRGQEPASALPRADPASVGVDAAALAAATATLQAAVQNEEIAGAVAAIARDGRLVYSAAVGVRDLASGAPMTESTLFRIYSMTKPVTAVAVMMLWEEGRFRLEDPVSQYLPEFGRVRVGQGESARAPGRPVTIEDLLLHTAGLSHRTSELYRSLGVRSRADSLPRFVEKITRAPLMEDPGTRFRYSEATTVLGRLVEVWSGMPFDRFLEDRVLAPLRMRDTRFWVDAASADRLATVYGPDPAGGLRPVEIETVPFTTRPALLEGAVGLVSSVPDFLRFAQLLLNAGELDGVRLLKPETAARMVRNGLPAAVLQARGGRMGWGLGNVNVVLDPGGVRYPAAMGEYGWDGTAGTIFWNDPATRTAIVLMTQSSPADPAGLRARFKASVHAAIR